MEYRNLNDDELISYIQENDEEAYNIMYKKYEPLINSIASKMIKLIPNSGLETSDLKQEGRLGLTYAIKNFNSSKETSFFTYAKMCIERKIISCVISSKRLKHKILNESISVDFKYDDEEHNMLEYLFEDNSSNPETRLFDYEQEKQLIQQTKSKLTDFELQVFELKLSGFSYKEIANILEKKKKTIDNAIQRIKNKFKEIIKNNY